eukprot:TRINITY_DN2076_c0_g1_i1.p1 TRINITY_DN2076_c0_g1~~TRINITY_DN2076_c0_g1_i1.p1  ORF type:complete len:427 (-),score=129.80 TRINITY_DN2076_c0_g1_i1:246-1526(-)
MASQAEGEQAAKGKTAKAADPRVTQCFEVLKLAMTPSMQRSMKDAHVFFSVGSSFTHPLLEALVAKFRRNIVAKSVLTKAISLCDREHDWSFSDKKKSADRAAWAKVFAVEIYAVWVKSRQSMRRSDKSRQPLVQKCRDLMLDADNNAPADGDDPPLADDAKEDEGDASDGDSGVSVAPPETVATSVTIQADDEVTMVLPDVGGRRLVRISCAAPKPVLETMEKMNTLQPPALKKGKGDDDGDAVCEVGGGGSNSINSDAIRNKPAAAKTAAKKRPAAAAVAGGENAAGNKKTKYTVVEATAVPQEKTQAAVEYLGSFACGKEYFNKLPPCTYPNNVDIDLQKRSWTRHIRATGGALEVSVEVNAAKKHFYVVKGVDDNTRRQAGIPSAGEKRNYGWGRSEDSCLEAWKKACVRAGLPGWESFVLK